MHFDEHFLRGAASDVTIVCDTFPEHPTFCIDTRTLKQGDIFVALQGTQGDGHQFLHEALEKGAAGLFLQKDKKNLLDNLDQKYLSSKLIVLFENVLDGFVSCAQTWRAQFDYPVVAITGSVGKTSTKHIVANILSCNGSNALISEANQNTNLGLALNMMKMRPDHDVAVFEVGISRRGEMEKLSEMLKPTTALITNIGHCHMEGLGSVTDIALEKRDVFKQFSEDSIGIINGDQPILAQVGYPHPVIKFGSKTTNQIQARKIKVESDSISFVLKIYKEKHSIVLKHVHKGAVFNALSAVAITQFLGVNSSSIIEGIQSAEVVESRFERRELKHKKGVIINDCYNANPESMKAALLAFEKIETGAHKIAVLGDMLELGPNSPFWHRQLGRFLRKVPSLNSVILVGDLVKWTKKTVPVGFSVEIVPSWEDAIDTLNNRLTDDNLVLVKASNGVKLGNLVKHFSNG